MAPIVASAPVITAYLCAECREHYQSLQAHLEGIDIVPRQAPHLVRGLDYYTRTAFEFYRPGQEGQQSALGAGGRYDGLLELLGAKPTPGVGLALGIDRIAGSLERDEASAASGRPVAVVVGADPMGTDLRLRMATDLRAAGVAARADLAQRKLARQLENAARDEAHFAVVIGDELTAGQVQLRDLQAGTQRLVNVAELARELLRAHAGHRHGES